MTKTINIISNNLGLLKISEKSITIFVNESRKLVSKNYDILSKGIKWTINRTETLLNKEVISCFKDKNYILFKNKNSKNNKWEYSLFEINNYDCENIEYTYDNKYQCILI